MPTGASSSAEGAMAGADAWNVPVSQGPDVSSGMSDVPPPGGTGGDFWSRAAMLLKDPEMIKALGKFASNVGSTMGAAQKLPPQAQQLFGEYMQQQQGGGNTGRGYGSSGPYVGDASVDAYLRPETAKIILRSMGIPS